MLDPGGTGEGQAQDMNGLAVGAEHGAEGFAFHLAPGNEQLACTIER
jgi:hypothetical protein